MIIDVFTFNGEYDLLEIRLNILGPYVDQFIIVEAPTTFSGKPKPLYYEEQKERYKAWQEKIKYHVIDENYTEEEQALADSSPNTRGATHWKREFLQKESIKKALTHLQDDDIVFIGDVDEILFPRKSDISDSIFDSEVWKLKLRVYTYWLNNRSSEEFWGPIITKYKNIKNECLNHLRANAQKTNEDFGWHFTSMGGYEEVKRKLSDSYTEESYWNKSVQDSLYTRMALNKDFLGREFEYRLDESDWPPWLKENREHYKHLLKP